MNSTNDSIRHLRLARYCVRAAALGCAREMNITPELQREIGRLICNPVGSVTFEYTSAEAFRANSVAGVLIEIPAGGHLFRVDRTQGRILRFFHASPGTGTRVASIPLGALPDFDRAFLAFTWSPEATAFYCGPRGVESGLLSAKGEPSATGFQVGRDGSVFEIGAPGVQVMGVRFRRDGDLFLAPTAREVWTSTVQAIDVLWTAKSDQGFIFEVVLTSATLSMLVTGLENYASTRLLEVEREGVRPDAKAVFDSFASKAERESERLKELEAIAGSDGSSVLTTIVATGRIHFQSYDNLKRTYRAAYGIKFGEMGISSQAIEEVQEFIRYRHRVVHVSPLLGMLNEQEVPPKEPVFANRHLAERARKRFDEFVNAVHNTTLRLRAPSGGAA